MRSTEFIYVIMRKKTLEKGSDRTKLYLRFKSGFMCQHRKTMLKIEFYKLNSGLIIFAVYWTCNSA